MRLRVSKRQQELLASAGDLPEQPQRAVEKLLNVVEALSADKNEFAEEVRRLRQQLDQKKKSKTTAEREQDGQQTPPPGDSDHSSEKRRRKRDKKRRRAPRSFKDLKIHETIECPVDPDALPPDAVRLQDEIVIVQDIEIKPHNIRFQRQVYYSPHLPRQIA